MKDVLETKKKKDSSTSRRKRKKKKNFRLRERGEKKL